MSSKKIDPKEVKSHWLIMIIVNVLLLVFIWAPISIFFIIMSIPFNNSVPSQVGFHGMMYVIAFMYPFIFIISGALAFMLYRQQEYKTALKLSYVPIVYFILGIFIYVMLIIR